MYILFCLSNIIGAWIFKKIRHSRYDSCFILGIIFLLSILMKIVSHVYIFITIMTLLVILVSLYSNDLEFFLRKNIDSKILGTIASINSTISRLFSFLVLIACSVLVSFMNIIDTFILLVLIFCILSIFVMYKFTDNKKENIK
ncbi:hypothetical protein [Borrelia miyamotoi]|uniref:hypothetical protein n=1 Tax=Borrelia miyamotoi TaxID=47466 RepID=UPI001F5B7056|nr:hypothetical protein [Borrelia miyamotoi]